MVMSKQRFWMWMGLSLLLLGGAIVLFGCSQNNTTIDTLERLTDLMQSKNLEGDISVHLPTNIEAGFKETFIFGSPGGYIQLRVLLRAAADNITQ